MPCWRCRGEISIKCFGVRIGSEWRAFLTLGLGQGGDDGGLSDDDEEDGDDDDGGGASDTRVRRKQLINCSKHIFATWNFRFPTNEETR